MICNPQEKIQMLRDAVKEEYRDLAKMDISDPDVMVKVDNNRRLSNVLKENKPKEIQKLVYGMVEDSKDPLTNNFKAVFEKEGKITLKANGNTRKEVVKSVEYVKGSTEYVKVYTYPTTKTNDVRTYTFAVGQDVGKGSQIGKEDYDVSMPRIGEYSKYLQSKSHLFGSKEDVTSAMLDSARKVDDYVHGNIVHMQSMMDLFSSGDKEYNKHGKELLGKFSPKFFKDLELFVGNAASSSNVGLAGSGRIDVYKAASPNSNRNKQNLDEVYLHEVLHTMIMFAFNNDSTKARKLRNELSELVLEAKRSIAVEDLYPDNATDSEKEIASEMYDYIFDNNKGSEIGDQEFLVHALSNPTLINKLKELGIPKLDKSLLDKIVDFFSKVTRVLLGDLSVESVNRSMYDHAYNLAYRLGEINAEMEKERSILIKSTDAVVDLVNDMDSYVADKIQLVKSKLVNENAIPDKYPTDGTKMEKNLYMLKFAKYAMTHQEYRKTLGHMFTSYGLSPTSSIREFVGGFFERSPIEKTVDWLGLAAGKVDTMRESIVNSSKAMILEGFNKELREFEDEALTKMVIDTNLGVVYKDYGLDGVRKFAESDVEINAELKVLKKNLSNLDKANYNWLEAQAHGLGYYMATHIGNEAQNTNSYNIAKGFGADAIINTNKDIEATVSKIASLTALRYSKEGKGEVLVDLIDRHPEGVKNVINIYEGFKTQAKETVFKGDPVHLIEGYSSEQFDQNIEVKVLPSKQGAELKSLGFRKVKDLSRVDVNGSQLSVYVSEGYGVKERLRGAVKMVSMQAKGTSLKDVIFNNSMNPKIELRVKTKMFNAERSKINTAMASGNYDPTKFDTGAMALLDSEGRVADYRFTMNKRSKKDLLNQDTRVSEVLPRSSGHVIDKIYTAEQNAKVVEVIKTDMENNWNPKTGLAKDSLTEYVVIKADSKKEEYAELYKMLPKELRTYAESRDDKSLAVPATLYHDFFGYQHLSIVHNKYAKHLPKLVNKIIGMLETLWMDLVKVVKGNILMKMPIVLIGNVVSNFILRVVNGANPFVLVKDYYDSFVDVRKFTSNNRDIIRLSNEVAASKEELKTRSDVKLEKEVKDKENEIARKKLANDNNPVKELVDAGLYQAIVEDVEVSTVEAATVWGKMGDMVLGKLPGKFGKGIRTGVDVLYFNQRTKWFKVNQEIMQLSDLIARDVQNRTAKVLEQKQVDGRSKLPSWWLKEKGWDIDRKLITREEKSEFKESSKQVRMYSLLEYYINYTRPSGRGEEYLNRMGILMFTKYAKRIQKVIMDQGTNYPLKTLLGLVADGGIMNMSMIQDQHIFAKEWHMDDHGAGNFYPIYSALDHIENFITPALIKDSTWDFLPI